jgi:alpha-glucosidase (family GH31 glycosyl hydrolase)
MPNLLQGIQHVPYGIEHPYRQGSEERQPRDPHDGQPVVIGALTWPAGAAEEVWVEWNGSGQPEPHLTPAELQPETEGQPSCWTARLPAFTAGQQVEYRVLASQDQARVSTELFSFTVTGWQPWGDVAGCRMDSQGVELFITSQQGEMLARLRLDLSRPEQVKIKAAYASPGSDFERADANCTPQDAGSYQVRELTPDRLVLETTVLRVVVDRTPYRLSIFRQDGFPLLQEAEPPAWLIGEPGQARALRQEFFSPGEEGFYGFGERFTAFNQRGSQLDVRVFEQFFAEGRRTYIPIPFFLSSLGYGHYLHTSRCVTYDLAHSGPERWAYQAEVGQTGELEWTLWAGAPLQVSRAFTSLTGRPALPPTWAFGPWMSGNEWNSQARVLQELQHTLEHDIPATVLVIEAWSDESTFYIWNDAVYEPKASDQPFSYADFTFPAQGRWPDPKGMIDRLHELGIRLVLWQIPVLKKLEEPHPQHNADEAHVVEQGYCVHRADGSPYQVRPFWFHDALLMDFTNPAAVEWWMGKRAYLVEQLGVDGFKTDGGEHLWDRSARFHNGMRGDEAWNLYPNQYVGETYRFITQKKNGDAITFSRAGFTGAQAFPLHWAGDEYSTWEALQQAVVAGLNAGLSGIPFWGWDIAGFSGEIPTAELYLRSTAMAAFCPVMQYHSDFNHHREPKRDRTPWNIAERTGEPAVLNIYRRYAKLRMQLLPYIEAEAAHCAASGEPLMRPLLLDWPEDPEAWQISDQYSFGRALLVAPVIQPGHTERRLYLPAGEWQDLWTGENLTGGQWITRPAPIDIIPVYRRLDRDFPHLNLELG